MPHVGIVAARAADVLADGEVHVVPLEPRAAGAVGVPELGEARDRGRRTPCAAARLSSGSRSQVAADVHQQVAPPRRRAAGRRAARPLASRPPSNRSEARPASPNSLHHLARSSAGSRSPRTAPARRRRRRTWPRRSAPRTTRRSRAAAGRRIQLSRTHASPPFRCLLAIAPPTTSVSMQLDGNATALLRRRSGAAQSSSTRSRISRKAPRSPARS